MTTEQVTEASTPTSTLKPGPPPGSSVTSTGRSVIRSVQTVFRPPCWTTW
ncbi:hypothetical protein ACQKH1_11255 [Staphylococcus capitis]